MTNKTQTIETFSTADTKTKITLELHDTIYVMTSELASQLQNALDFQVNFLKDKVQ